jgi:hypothetical protein
VVVAATAQGTRAGQLGVSGENIGVLPLGIAVEESTRTDHYPTHAALVIE